MKRLLQKKIVRDAILYTSSHLVVQVSGLLGILLVSRYLGPTNLGLYSFIQNYLAAFVTVISGLDMYANWNCVKSDDYYKELVIYTKMKAVIMGCLVLGYLIFSSIVLPHDIFFISLFSVIPLVTSIFSSYIFVVQYQNHSRIMTFTTAVSAVTLLIAKMIAVFTSQPLSVFVAITSLDGILLSAVCVTFLISKQTSREMTVLRREDFLKLFRGAFFPVIYVLTWFALVRVDQFLVPLYFSAYTLGVYAAAVKVIEMSNVLVVIMQSLVVPRVKLLQNPKEDLRRTHLSLFAYLSLGILCALFITLFAERITNLLFGVKFAETAHILRIYAWTIPGLFVSYFFGIIGMSKHSYKELASMSATLGALAVALSFLAAKMGSVSLIALVSVFIYTLSAFTSYIFWRKNLV